MSVIKKLGTDIKRNKAVYIMAIPLIAYYICFHFVPMVGTIIAFENYKPAKGILGSSWVWFDNFIDFFTNFQFGRLLSNTLSLSGKLILFTFPAPIILALLINELHYKRYRKIVQSISYMPHFISLVVVCGMINSFTASDGVITDILVFFGFERKTLLMDPELFQPVYIISEIWQTIGWSSIIYLSAISSIDPGLYESATIDGAGRFKQLLHITLPSLLPTIIMLFIMRIGNIMSLGYEKVMLLSNATNLSTSDIISYYAYRRGLLDADYGFSTAVSFFNSTVNFIILFCVNKLSKKVTSESLW